MPKAQLIKSEIQEIQKLKDIAEIMSAMAAANLILFKQAQTLLHSPYQRCQDIDGQLNVIPHNQSNVIEDITQLIHGTSKPFLTCNTNLSEEDDSKTLTIVIGSDLGFCGKFNKKGKEIAKSSKAELCLIGKQLTGLKVVPIPLPTVKITGSPVEKAKAVITITKQYVSDMLFGSNGILNNSFESMNIAFNILNDQKISFHTCTVDIQSMQQLDPIKNESTLLSPAYKHVFFDLYEKNDSIEKEYAIFDPSLNTIQEALYSIKKQFIVQLLTSCIIDSIIAENHSRSTSMESTKDEAQQIIHQLNKKMAKERQARITGELIELITSFTSLNQAV